MLRLRMQFGLFQLVLLLLQLVFVGETTMTFWLLIVLATIIGFRGVRTD